MVQIPETRRKLQEAQSFCYALLREEEMGCLHISGRAERFRENLSAFLSAGRSVTFVLKKEQKARYKNWFPRWKDALPESDQERLDFFRDERNAGVHEKGANVARDIEHIPATEIRPDHRLHPTHGYGITLTAPVGTPPPSVGLAVHYFEIEGTVEKVTSACRRYLSLLVKLVCEFEQAHSSPEQAALSKPHQ